MKWKEFNQMFSWSANSVVNVPILFALIGFFYCILIFRGGCGKVDFHEVYLLNKDTLSDSIVKQRINSLTAFVKANEKYKILKKDSDDSFKFYNALYHRAKSSIISSKRELANISSGDSSLNTFATYADINNERLGHIIASLQASDTVNKVWNADIVMRDTCTFPFDSAHTENPVLKLTKSDKPLMSFFSGNSTFGFWLFLSIAQMCFWFLLIPLVIGAAKPANDMALTYNAKSALVFAIIPFIFIVLFAYLIYWKLIDTYVINDVYFMQGFNNKMVYYSAPGYIVAILCFSTYLFLSNCLEQIDKSDIDPAVKLERFQKLTKAFNFAFLCSAIVLTVFVFWVAILFNGINETEAMLFYKAETGSSFLNNDFVYLIGLVHSLLLFIFYVPVKLRFASLNISQEQTQTQMAGLTPAKKITKNVLETLSTILVTTSPLIAPLLKKLIEFLAS